MVDIKTIRIFSKFSLININRLFFFFLVANKWLHERGQEFLRPCTLENQTADEADVRH